MRSTSRSTSTVVQGLLALCGLLLLVLGPSSAQDSSPHRSPDGKYVGSKACKKCHLKIYNSWSETRMAKAFSILEPGARREVKERAGLDPGKDYRTDPTCIECHTVGAGREGGFAVGYDIEGDPKRLLGVGCESCHGPGGNYTNPGQMDRLYEENRTERRPEVIKAGLVTAPDIQTCTRCHNDANPTFKLVPEPFDFETRRAKGVHEPTAGR